eukprot:TRINITY_DN19275_c0_g1_i1.p1 TRINITY_DN19275_c0_g1~~TRINITY_DN19275_c0_g1_i1.p1  ORF type:complete len:1537 (+),score=317.56 TRINITY_DN19275_c0_g1_i1:102-4712(+)
MVELLISRDERLRARPVDSAASTKAAAAAQTSRQEAQEAADGDEGGSDRKTTVRRTGVTRPRTLAPQSDSPRDEFPRQLSAPNSPCFYLPHGPSHAFSKGPVPGGQASRTTQGQLHRRRPGATIVPLREVDGTLQVLVAQTTVVNFLKSKPGQITLMDMPGEFRLLGAYWKPEDVTPLDTAIRGLTSAGWKNARRFNRSFVAEREQLGRAGLQSVLFKASGPGTKCGGQTRSFHFICTLDPAVSEHFVNTLSRLLETQHAWCLSKGKELYTIAESIRAPMCPIFQSVGWWTIDAILGMNEQDFINDFQRQAFKEHNIQARIRHNAHLEVLRRLQGLSVERAFGRALKLERRLRMLDVSEMRSSKYPELEVSVPGFERLQVLSFNMNILPFGVRISTGQQYGRARLGLFLDHIRSELAEERRSKCDAADEDLRSPGSLDETPAGSIFRALDVIALQELFASPFAPGLCLQAYAVREMAKLGYAAVTGENPSLWNLLRDGKWTDSGLVIFSRLPVHSSRALRFASGASLDAGACKGAIWAKLQLAHGRFLDVFNCHLQASHTSCSQSDSGLYDSIRHSQVAELQRFLQLAGNEHPVLLTGDFNVDAIPESMDAVGQFGFTFRPPMLESKDYKRLVQSLDPNNRYKDLLRKPSSDVPHPCTRPPRLKLPSSARYATRHKYPQRLDYVFYRPTLNSLIEHSHTHLECFEVLGNNHFDHISDHFGIRCHFKLRCGFVWATEARLHTLNETQDSWPVRWFPSGYGLQAAIGLILAIAALPRPDVRWLLLHPGVWCILLLLSLCVLFVVVRKIRPQTGTRQLVVSAAEDMPAASPLASPRSPRQSQRNSTGGGLESAYLPPSPRSRKLQALQGDAGLTQTIASSPYDTFNGSVDAHSCRPCLGRRALQPDGTLGDYTWLTYHEVQREVLRISSGLHRRYNLKRNTRVGLLGDACAEWLLCDISLMRCGVDIVCLAAPAAEGREVPKARDWGLELLCVSSEWLEYFAAPERQPDERPHCPIVSFEQVTPRLAALAASTWGVEVVSLEFVAHFGEVSGWVPYVGAGGFEVHTTMFRSRTGTRSELAGVSVSLQALAISAGDLAKALRLRSTDVHFSYGWPAFAAERVMLHAVLACGGAIGFFGGTRSPRIFEDIRFLRPTFLAGTTSLFKNQLLRLNERRQVGLLARLCFSLHHWALQQVSKTDAGDDVGQLSGLPQWWQRWLSSGQAKAVARCCLVEPLATLLSMPFAHTRAALIGHKTRLRFVLAFCTSGNTCLPPDRCLWMRMIFMCPVMKGLVAVEAGGLVTLGEAPYLGGADATMESFAVGSELNGARLELLPLSLPVPQPVSILQSERSGIELGTLRLHGISGGSMRVGIVCGRRGKHFYCFGRLVSLEESCNGHPALCEALEQLLGQHRSLDWLSQLLLTARPEGLVGIASVREEELSRLVKRIGLAESKRTEELCKDPFVRQYCLEQLQRCADEHGFTAAERPRAVHLQMASFSLKEGLQTPTLQLRRDLLLPHLKPVIDSLFEEIATTTAATETSA